MDPEEGEEDDGDDDDEEEEEEGGASLQHEDGERRTQLEGRDGRLEVAKAC
jgi:hypothetical protein